MSAYPVGTTVDVLRGGAWEPGRVVAVVEAIDGTRYKVLRENAGGWHSIAKADRVRARLVRRPAKVYAGVTYCGDCGCPDCPTVCADPFYGRCQADARGAS